MRTLHLLGRICQLIGLIAMPSAMWIAHFDRDERASIGVFVGSIIVFFMGYVFTSIAKRT